VTYFYVICPVGADSGFTAKKEILESSAREYGLEPFFPLEKHRGLSVREAKSDMEAAEFVLADLSFERPSCYFEIGLAQAAGLPISLIAATGTRIHQVGDSGESDVTFYSGLEEYHSAVCRVMANHVRQPRMRGQVR
jgi:hypothetical protein